MTAAGTHGRGGAGGGPALPCRPFARSPGQPGYGVAIRTGFQHSRGGLVYTDADRQFDISELAYFLPLAAENDLAIGFRVYRYDTMVRSMVSWVYNRLVGVLFRVGVRDVDCAFKLIRREVVDKLPPRATTSSSTPRLSPAPGGGTSASRRRAFVITRGSPAETTVAISDVSRTLRTVARMWLRIYRPTRKQREEAELIARRPSPPSVRSRAIDER